MSSQIRGKVARILNIRELVLNIGEDSGVRVGMIFDVLDSKGEDIIDPDTGRALGSLSRVKVQVRITSVQERLSVAETFHRREITLGSPASAQSYRSTISAIAQLFAEPTTVTHVETLKSTGGEYAALDEKDSYVKTGDVVVYRGEQKPADE